MPDQRSTDPDDSLRTSHTLLERLRVGEPAAWETFLTRYRGFIAGVLAQLIRPSERAQRATDEFWGYEYQYRSTARADPQRRFRSFLVGILRNYAREWNRRDRGRHVHMRDDVLEVGACDLVDQVEEALWADCVLSICMDRLRQRNERQANALCWFFGLPTESGAATGPLKGSEIALRLGVDANAVHALLLRARRALRSLVEAELHDTADSDDLDGELARLRTAWEAKTPNLIEH